MSKLHVCIDETWLFKVVEGNADKNQKRKIHVNGAGMITLLNRFHFHEKYRMEKKASGRNAIRNKLSELNSPA